MAEPRLEIARSYVVELVWATSKTQGLPARQGGPVICNLLSLLPGSGRRALISLLFPW